MTHLRREVSAAWISLLIVGALGAHNRSLAEDLSASLQAEQHPSDDWQGRLHVFDRLSATDIELRRFGYPPRPNRLRSPAAFAEWVRLTSPSVRRSVSELVALGRKHGYVPPGNKLAQRYINYSQNWSGYAIVGSASQFGSNSQYVVFNEFNVPTAQDPFGGCPAATYGSVWAGLDGVGSNDIVQGGVEADVSCKSGSRSTSYYTWVEWYPNLEYKLQNFPVSPGDIIVEEVYVVNTTTAEMYILDETKNAATSASFPAPVGVKFTGTSAEWVVETPSLGGNLTSLTNYTKIFTDENVSLLNNGKNGALYPGWLAQGFSLSEFVMTDPSGSVISQPTMNGPSSIAFAVEGSAK